MPAGTLAASRAKPMGVAQRINAWTRRLPAWVLYVVMPVPAVLWFLQALNGTLSSEPIRALEHLYGELGLQILIFGLAITPLRRFTKIDLVKFRRAIGLMAFLYITLHLLVWLVLDVGDLGDIWRDIVKRPYITIGMAGFLLLIPLAWTSNNRMVRKLGPIKWRRLHKLTYPAVLLGGIHFIMLAKTWNLEPMLYNAAIVLLLALRLKFPVRRASQA
ncbi:Membrane protein YedZ [Candidatus Rhodobacter oscarellae]|uniref:Protein-methionine-sulfoxide reductase heme-binding subunit MsrQ n=1 Tax=Candidatus Rhodobacter oscarellae TaxID=1675527 RepID=A0A0J9ECX7_9RHOB|nr:protein-methionine-sulfoxide reductase heme-binding subunit MsrQ [Candidatus Rhodobacter lobularis]KMW60536.1 Membrane protein YedZ [Candidatus Rhodobacter lobularis]